MSFNYQNHINHQTKINVQKDEEEVELKEKVADVNKDFEAKMKLTRLGFKGTSRISKYEFLEIESQRPVIISSDLEKEKEEKIIFSHSLDVTSLGKSSI